MEEIIKTNIKELPFKEVKKVSEVHTVKTAYTKVLETHIEDTKGDKYIVKTEQVGNNEPIVIDYVKVP